MNCIQPKKVPGDSFKRVVTYQFEGFFFACRIKPARLLFP